MVRGLDEAMIVDQVALVHILIVRRAAAAVDAQGDAAHVGCRIARHENTCQAHVTGSCEALGRHRLGLCGDSRVGLIAVARAHSDRVRQARSQRNDAHVRRELNGQRLRQIRDARFRGRVHRLRDGARKGRAGRKIDDHAALPLPHDAARLLAAQERALEVVANDGVKAPLADVGKARVEAAARIVDHDVERAELRKRSLDQRVDLGTVTRVHDKGQGSATKHADLVRRRLKVGL